MKQIAVAFVVCVVALTIWAVWSTSSIQQHALEVAQFLVLGATLVVLVLYAYDTNSIAQVTRERWMREGVLSTTYSMELVGHIGQPPARTLFRIHNPSPLVVRARVACNFQIYGGSVSSEPLYDGTERWLVFPQQVMQGWFEIATLLQMKGKTIAAMLAERTAANAKTQLTMDLELEFWDELGVHRQLPSRLHYFDFVRWAWIPNLAEPPS